MSGDKLFFTLSFPFSECCQRVKRKLVQMGNASNHRVLGDEPSSFEPFFDVRSALFVDLEFGFQMSGRMSSLFQAARQMICARGSRNPSQPFASRRKGARLPISVKHDVFIILKTRTRLKACRVARRAISHRFFHLISWPQHARDFFSVSSQAMWARMFETSERGASSR